MKLITFECIAELWLADKKQYVKRSTYAAYSLLVNNHLLTAFSGYNEIKETDVQAFALSKLEGGLSRKSVKDILVVLKMILSFAYKRGYMPYRDIKVRFPTEREQHEVAVLSRDDQNVLMSYVRNNFSFVNLGIYICLCCGLRIGEMCALRWDDVDIDQGIISISRTIQRIYISEKGEEHHTELIIDSPKSKTSNRIIPATEELMQIIRPLKRRVVGTDYVLTNSQDPIEPRTYRNHFNKLMNKLGISGVKFHGLRHTFATRCIESNCDYKTVSVLLGHSNISTTLNLYVHPDLDQKKKCLEKMFASLK